MYYNLQGVVNGKSVDLGHLVRCYVSMTYNIQYNFRIVQGDHGLKALVDRSELDRGGKRGVIVRGLLWQKQFHGQPQLVYGVGSA